MFGTKQREHDERYKVAAEWISLIKQLWTLDGFFDFEGEFFAAKDCYAEPKPVQDPHPIVMSAGHSDAGRRFAMTHADLLFAATSDPETTPDLVKEIKKTAAKEASAKTITAPIIVSFFVGHVILKASCLTS